jgi:Alpha/beta hydrolase domain
VLFKRARRPAHNAPIGRRTRRRVSVVAFIFTAGCLGAAVLGLAAGTAQARTLTRSPDAFQPPASASVPRLTGPLAGAQPSETGGGDAGVTPAVVAAAGYQEREFFIAGKANAYKFTGSPATDGKWSVSVVPGTTRSYTTRLVVFTPVRASRFSGNVVVEWANVTGGIDALADLIATHDELFRSGDAYVGVSAQFVGVENAKLSDPARYGALSDPGDSYSYDIFSQAGMAVRALYPRLLGGLKPRVIVATGESQSSFYLTTYVDAFARLYNVYDAYFVHSREDSSESLQQAPQTVLADDNGTDVSVSDGNAGLSNVSTPSVVLIRTDLTAPVLTFETQADVYAYPTGLLDFGPATQADSRDYRLWEAAGDAHADVCLGSLCSTDAGNLAGAEARFNVMLNPPTTLAGIACGQPVNTGEQGYSAAAGLESLIDQAATGGLTGTPPASPPLFTGQSAGEASAGSPRLDAHGNILGGLRTPAVDVPVATLSGQPQPGSLYCAFFGQTTPFTTAKLTALYPTHRAFVRAWDAAVARLVCNRELDPADGSLLEQAAARSTVS